MTGVGFSHSEIHGSKAVQRLTVAYRSRPRPSSTPGAKASTVCPSYLDGELSSGVRTRSSSVSTFETPPAHRMGTFQSTPISGVLGLVQFSRSTEATDGVLPPASLKTEQRPRGARGVAVRVRSTLF